jgi:hypothetical protein
VADHTWTFVGTIVAQNVAPGEGVSSFPGVVAVCTTCGVARATEVYTWTDESNRVDLSGECTEATERPPTRFTSIGG